MLILQVPRDFHLGGVCHETIRIRDEAVKKKRSCFDGRASPNKFSENGESEKPTWQFKLPSGKLT